MRVIRKPSIHYLIRLSQMVSLDQLQEANDERDSGRDRGSLMEFLAAPEPPTNPNDIVYEDVFLKLNPGIERVCVVLKANGYENDAIHAITGYTPEDIRQAFTAARSRLLDYYRR